MVSQFTSYWEIRYNLFFDSMLWNSSYMLSYMIHAWTLQIVSVVFQMSYKENIEEPLNIQSLLIQLIENVDFIFYYQSVLRLYFT